VNYSIIVRSLCRGAPTLAGRLRRVGHEAGSFSPLLQAELQQRGLPIVCLEAFHARAAVSAMRNKTGCR
jgi:transposase